MQNVLSSILLSVGSKLKICRHCDSKRNFDKDDDEPPIVNVSRLYRQRSSDTMMWSFVRAIKHPHDFLNGSRLS